MQLSRIHGQRHPHLATDTDNHTRACSVPLPAHAHTPVAVAIHLQTLLASHPFTHTHTPFCAQAIYGFRGANDANLTDTFARHFPDAVTLELGDNYRSGSRLAGFSDLIQ